MILLLFVILCAMFASAAVNNIIAVTGGIEHYFDAADVPDVIVQMTAEETAAEEWLNVLDSKRFEHNGKKLENFYNPAILISEAEMGINYFDEENNIIEKVGKSCFYANKCFFQDTDIRTGDDGVLTIGDTKRKLKFMGQFKGALFSNETNSNPVLILNQDDFHDFNLEESAHFQSSKMVYVKTSDADSIRELANDYDHLYVKTKAEYKDIYLYDMIAAYIMMIISIALMITAFVVLRFTIGFTISEAFREIGVMKAVGIRNGSIRGLYIVKYLAIAVIGSAIGFAGSIPLGNLMMKTVSENMVLGSDSSNLLGLISAVIVVSVIMLF